MLTSQETQIIHGTQKPRGLTISKSGWKYETSCVLSDQGLVEMTPVKKGFKITLTPDGVKFLTFYNNERLRDSLRKGSVGSIPDFWGGWNLENEFEGWKIYIVHDPCHDLSADRKTVIALHESGSWKIIGREVTMEMAKNIAHGLPL